MNQALYNKLKIKIRDAAQAELLVKAGFDTPEKIRKATDEELSQVLNSKQLSNVRQRIS